MMTFEEYVAEKEERNMQRCRFCSHLVVGDACYCERRDEVRSEKESKETNVCVYFDFLGIDAFGEHDYHPMDRRLLKKEYEAATLDSVMPNLFEEDGK